MSHADRVISVRRLARSHHAVVLVSDGRALPVRFVLLPEGGSLILCADRQAARATEHVLFAPDEGEASLQLLLDVSETTEERDGACDRWLAYHSEADHAHWLRARIDSAKLDADVFAGDRCAPPNPLAPCETRLLKRWNADPARISRACARLRGVEVVAAMGVGVDPDGIDVRARFGIVRLEFEQPALDEESALAAGDTVFGDSDA